MIKIYHNPRCSKSRQGLAIIQEAGKEVEIIKYLDDIPTENELKEVIQLLGISPKELVRKGETIWKENYKGRQLSDDEIINAMVTHPKLIERPIVVNGNKAVLGRPPENIIDII